MIEILNSIELECNKCKTFNKIEPDELGQYESDTEERSMGTETEFIWEHEVECSKCKNHIHLTIRAFEYPSGFLNYSDSECLGGTIISEPKINIEYDDQD